MDLIKNNNIMKGQFIQKVDLSSNLKFCLGEGVKIISVGQ